MKLKKMWLNINGVERMIVCDPEKDTLASLLRRWGYTGVKVGCGVGVCGACSVILNGEVVRACVRKMKTVAEYSTIITIEGVGTPMNLHPLQQAWITYGGIQCGFCTPGFIVSAYALLEKNDNPTRQEVRDWFQKHRNVCRCTGYKPIVDAVMAAAAVMRGEKTMEEITYQDPADKEFYGTGVPRPYGLAKATGTADYGDDIALKMPAGTLHVALVQPRITCHAMIKSIDTSAAEAMPGVERVLTAKDVPGTNRIGTFFGNKRSLITGPTRPILCDTKIHRYGDVVALVVADTDENARAAAAAVKVDIDPLPEYMNFLDAVQEDSVPVVENFPNVYVKAPLIKGEDVRPIIEKSKYSVEGSFYSSREPHLSIEGDVMQSYYDEDGLLTIQCKAMNVYGVKGSISAGLAVPPEQIRVIENYTGGSFGWAISGASYSLVALATVVTGMPCTLSMSYEEFMHYSGKRCPAYVNARFACDENGKLTAMEYQAGLDHGAYPDAGDGLAQRMRRFMGFPYYWPNIRGMVSVANTNHAQGTAYRAYGSPQVYTAGEAMMDMLAEKAGIDPFEFRFINVAREGQDNCNSYPFRQYPMEKLLNRMRPFYQEALARAKAEDTPELRRGVGIAMGGYNVTGGQTDNATCDVEILPGNRFAVYNTWEEQGQGGDIGSVMHVLEGLKVLGITPKDVEFRGNDSKTSPNSGPASGSRSHYMNGNAIKAACEKLLSAMKKDDGSYRTYDEMKAEGLDLRYSGTYMNTIMKLPELDDNTGVGDPTPAYTYCVFLVEVAVETKTGKTRVLSMRCIDSIGKIGNKISVEGQAFGGMSHSIGFALSEDYQDVKKHINHLRAGVPYINDIPDEMYVDHLGEPIEDGPWGSSGASEAYQCCGHVAVINAIYDACKVRVYELPATAEKVKAGIDAIARGEQPYKPAKYWLGSDMYDDLEYIAANPV